MGTNDQQVAPQGAPTVIDPISPIQSEIDAFAKSVDSLIATFPLGLCKRLGEALEKNCAAS
jgi:hypothetical protein